MNVFIDTNVFLAFYHFSNDDLKELEKLAELLRTGAARLFTTSQIIDEFRRNRDGKIEDALKRMRDLKLAGEFPPFCKDYPQYERLKELQKEHKAAHAELLKTLTGDIAAERLKADALIGVLFGLSTNIAISESIFGAAWRRAQLGNPPGKPGSLGDALNWEALLAETPAGVDLHLITDDKDFASPLNNSSACPFLAQEWRGKRGANLWLYPSLSSFFRDHYPNIKLTLESQKDALIDALFVTHNFAATHAVVAALLPHMEFTASQANRILEAAISNTQVSWICSDPDVKELLQRVIAARRSDLNADILDQALRLLGEVQSPPNLPNPDAGAS